MPRGSLIKQKYHEKVLSEDGVYVAWRRDLDVAPLYAEYVWTQLTVFDLSELGLGLLYNILPVDYQPLGIDYAYQRPTPSETLQGVWAKFEPVRFDVLYVWMTDMREYVFKNFKEVFQPDLLITAPQKAVWGVTPYGRGIYDPIVAREFLRATFHRLRLMRTPDLSWLFTMDGIVEFLRIIGVTDEHIFNRLMMLFSAQTNAFVLGLSLLGRAKLSETEGDLAKIPVLDARGEHAEAKFRTLDHLQMGLILGLTPLGYGLLLPKESVYVLPDGKKNPPFLKVMTDKIIGMIRRLSLSTWSYTNYNKPEEMVDRHRSDRTAQYRLIQVLREHIEELVFRSLPPEELNPVSGGSATGQLRV